MTVLIIGSNGGVGKRLARWLHEKVPDVTCLGAGRSPQSRNSYVTEYVAMDLSTQDYRPDATLPIDKLLSRSDAVVFLAALAHGRFANNEAYQTINTVAPAEVYRRYGAKIGNRGVFIFASSIAVYGRPGATAHEDSPIRPLSQYGQAKATAEERLVDSSRYNDMPALRIARLAAVVSRDDRGNLGRLVSFASRYRTIPTTSAVIPKTFVDIDDVSRAIIALISIDQSVPTIVNVAGPSIELRDVFERIASVADVRRRIWIPVGLLKLFAKAMVVPVRVDNSKAEDILGMRFGSFEEAFIREYASERRVV